MLAYRRLHRIMELDIGAFVGVLILGCDLGGKRGIVAWNTVYTGTTTSTIRIRIEKAGCDAHETHIREARKKNAYKIHDYSSSSISYSGAYNALAASRLALLVMNPYEFC